MIPFLWAAAGTAAFMLLLIMGEYLQRPVIKWIAKPLASLCFLAAALAPGWPDTAFAGAVLVALIFCFWGDVLLIPRATAAFAGGLGSFLVGHLIFAVAFVIRDVSWIWAAFALAPLALIGLLVLRWLRPHVPARLWIPVIAYVVVITAMVALAVATLVARTDRQGIVLAGAATAFWLSDVAVARDRFVAPGPTNRLWGLPLYYGAQLCFALSLSLTG